MTQISAKKIPITVLSANLTGCIRTLLLTTLTLFCCGAAMAGTAPYYPPIHNIGFLTDLYSVKGAGESYYQFKITNATPVSAFVNGLSAGYRIDLLDAQGKVLKSSSNRGTEWTSSANPGATGGAVVESLTPNFYYVHVIPVAVTGNPLYQTGDQTYTLNLIPDNAPNTVVVSPTNSPIKGNPAFMTTGTHDEAAINRALATVAKQGAGRVLLRPGTYYLANNILTTYDNITLMGTGWMTVLKVSDNAKLQDAGLIRSRFYDATLPQASFNNQHVMHMVLDGNKSEGTDYLNTIGIFGTYTHSSFEDVRVHDFPNSGINPEMSLNGAVEGDSISIQEALVDHNDVDGIVFETINNSFIQHNIVDTNGRHGINLAAGSMNNTVKNNRLYGNAANGVTIQAGSDMRRFSNNNAVVSNVIANNGESGVYINQSNAAMIAVNEIQENGKYGIQLRGSSNNLINENVIGIKSSGYVGKYSGIGLSGNGWTNSTYNQVTNNTISAQTEGMYKFGVSESSALDDYNSVTGNTILNIAKPVRLKGPHSVANHNN